MTMIIVPYTIPSQNLRDKWHWAKKAKDRNKAQNIIELFCKINRIQRMPPDGKAKMEIHSYRPKKCTDIANLIGGAKGLVDAIVRANLLEDDADKCVEISYFQHSAINSPSKKACTMIIIEQLTNQAEKAATEERL